MAFDFKSKRVIVCGGSRGIGRAIALGFAGAGAHVSICARSETALHATESDITARGGAAHAATCDLSDGAAISTYIPAAADALGGVDILVNNASGFGMGDDDESWSMGANVDVMATVRASRAALPFLEKSPAAAIVNISSISAYRASTRTPAYGAVKAAIVHYTSSQAAALARRGIRVNCIAPGSIEFPGGTWEKRRSSDPALYQRVLGSIPFDRLGTPDEIANVALFLASPYASWITGQTIIVDGGQLLG
ncbi:MAG: SDR family NAD(P)-dependent oxidoreductase [Beijerinckiaceae bacterium]